MEASSPDGQRYRERVDESNREAKALGVTGTPSYLIGRFAGDSALDPDPTFEGTLLLGANEAELRSVVQQALDLD